MKKRMVFLMKFLIFVFQRRVMNYLASGLIQKKDRKKEVINSDKLSGQKGGEDYEDVKPATFGLAISDKLVNMYPKIPITFSEKNMRNNLTINKIDIKKKSPDITIRNALRTPCNEFINEFFESINNIKGDYNTPDDYNSNIAELKAIINKKSESVVQSIVPIIKTYKDGNHSETVIRTTNLTKVTK